MFKKILFPTDFSESAIAPVPYVTDLATKYGSKVYVLHVLYDIARASGWHVPSIDMETFYSELRSGAEEELERFTKEHLSGLPEIEKAIKTGMPSEEIVNFVHQNGIDLVIISTHGRSGINRVLFGSTASRVVRQAPCPILTVRMPAKKHS